MTQLIADNIARIMAEQSMNATELAERASLNRTAIYDILAGRSSSPRVKTVAQIAKALGVPISDLFLTVEQLNSQNQLVMAYRELPPAEQQRLFQIARALLPTPQ